MKILIASDIHGSAYYCDRLLRAFTEEQCGRMLLLGDILYHGPRNDLPKGYDPKSVADSLNGIKESILCVRGNCDCEVDQMVLDFPVLADYAVVLEGGRVIYATHGHIYNEENVPPLSPGSILLNGHTHISGYRIHENYVYINPGSVSIPKEGTPNSYMTLEDDEFLWKEIESGQIYKKMSLKEK